MLAKHVPDAANDPALEEAFRVARGETGETTAAPKAPDAAPVPVASLAAGRILIPATMPDGRPVAHTFDFPAISTVGYSAALRLVEERDDMLRELNAGGRIATANKLTMALAWLIDAVDRKANGELLRYATEHAYAIPPEAAADALNKIPPALLDPFLLAGVEWLNRALGASEDTAAPGGEAAGDAAKTPSQSGPSSS